MCEQAAEYFQGQLKKRDAAELRWSHAVNSRSKLTEALQGPTHMIEADIIVRGYDPKEPVMGHPPDTDSDITLKEWLECVTLHDKGIKLDFKSLEAVSLSVALLQQALVQMTSPVWVNADILPGPGIPNKPLEPQAFLAAVKSLPTNIVLSLGWITKWTTGTDNPGYSWEMVHEMQDICRGLEHLVTFPVRAALLAQSVSQLAWLLQQSDRYSLTVWTGQNDKFKVEDLLPYRTCFDVSRICYDLPEALRVELTDFTRSDMRNH
ncbi:protein FAM151B isoform X1 [Syngnathus acus]|uniref:protein FAM151B isoform X1 n=2 Tax=Syngnathus acus TaxID=161584 RepID=UPI001885DA5B|nr:protein FAM151B isoform X1 [Syngnathus acus]XP_037115446.1 protein FAM151B isoform X1 [Syngnathus acus]